MNAAAPSLATALALTLGLAVSCTSEVNNNRQSSVSSTTDGGITSTVKLGAKGGQILTQKDSNDKAVAQILIQPGALATGQVVSVSNSYHTDSAEVATEFGIEQGVTINPMNVATVVSSNTEANLAKPMTIALELSSATPSFGLTYNDRNYVVIYTVYDYDTKVWKRGVIPDASLVVENDMLRFQTDLFGRFELFELSKPMETAPAPRVISTPDFSSAPLELTAVKPLVAAEGDTVTLEGKYLHEDVQLSVAGYQVPLIKNSAQGTLRFRMPSLPFGLKTIRVAANDGEVETSAQVVSRPLTLKYPIITLAPSQVCEGVTFYDMYGKVWDGQKVCEKDLCSADGELDCVTSESHPAIAKAKIPYDQLLSDAEILGQAGGYTVTTVPDCTMDGQPDCKTNAAFKAADMNAIMPGYIKKGIAIAGVQGSLLERLTDCSADGQQGCSVPSDYRAVPITKLNKGDIRDGKVIGGVTGQYPSTDHPLNGASVMADLDSATFNVKMKSPAAFEYFDSKGVRYTATGDSDIVEANIKSGVSIFGTTGTIDTAPTDTANDNSTLVAEDLRYGVTVGGVTGSLKTRCRNGVNLDKANYATGSGTDGKDVFDTIIDEAIPNASAWDSPEHTCDATGWEDRTVETGNGGNSFCMHNGADCLFYDKTHKTYWFLKTKDSGRDFEEAATRCSGLTYKGGGWRVPTQKEAMTAYVHGFATMEAEHYGMFINGQTWTSTNHSDGQTTSDKEGQNKVVFNMRDGLASEAGASGSMIQAICIKD